MATNTYAMVGNGGRQGAGFQSGPHAGVAPGNDAHAGGAYVPASTPTGASAGGFAQRAAVGGPPPRFGVPEVNFAQPEKRSNARVPYARVVMMHGKNDTNSDELRLKVAKRGREYEYEGLHTGELAWTLTLHGLRAPGTLLDAKDLAKRNDTGSNKRFVYTGAEQLFSIAEDTAAKPGKVLEDATAMDLGANKSVSDLVRSSDRLPQPFAGNQQNRATRLASTGWVEAVFAQGLRHVTIDLNATTLTGHNDERVALHADIARWANEGARPFGTAAFAERNTGALNTFTPDQLTALLNLAQTTGTSNADATEWEVKVGTTAVPPNKDDAIDALAKAPATHSCIANYTVLSAPDLAYSMQKTMDGQDLQVGHPMRQGLFLLEDGPFLRTIGSEHGRQVTVELFDKQNEGEEPRERSRLEQVPRHLGSSLAQSAMCAELAAKGLLCWRPDGVCLGKYGEDSQQLVDNAEFDAQQGMLFNVGVQGPCITTSWTNGGEMACNPTDEVYVLLKCTAFYELSATTGSTDASFETVCALSDANTAAQRFAAAARPKNAPTTAAPTGADINKLLAGIASGVPMAASESGFDEKTGRALSAACFDALWATERGRVLADEKEATAAWRAGFGATKGLYKEAFAAVESASAGGNSAAASNAVRAAREKLLGGGFRDPMKDGTWARWQMQYKSGAASAKAFVTDFELVRTTSSFLFARSHFDPNDAKSRCGLRSGLVEASATKATGFSEFFVGGWKVGKVQDAAAARAAATPAIAGASPRNPAMKIDVDVQWLDADALHARFMDRDANASVARLHSTNAVTRTFESTTCSRPEATARSTSDQTTVGKAVALREFAKAYTPQQLSAVDLAKVNVAVPPNEQNAAAVALREVGAHEIDKARLVSFAGSGRAAGWGPNADARGAYAWTDPAGEPLIRALDDSDEYAKEQLQPDPHGRRAAVALLGSRKAGDADGTLLESGKCPYFADADAQRKNSGIVAKTAKHYKIKSWGAAGDDKPTASASIVPPPLVKDKTGAQVVAVATAVATAVA
jgi:hypothetical protein